MKNLKKAIAPIAMAAVMLSTSALPASAANVRRYYSQSGKNYSILTQCTGFRRYVTANATVQNLGSTRRRAYRGYRNAKVTASKYCPIGPVYRNGWASNY